MAPGQIDRGRGLAQPPESSVVGQCLPGTERALVPAEAQLRLEVNAVGRVTAAVVETSMGDGCSDGILTAIANSLWYEWLPNETFPPPVILIQPMRVVAATADEA
ncbi:MAG: hypothetical protein WD960_07195 [Gemmatimonadota bacterium]